MTHARNWFVLTIVAIGLFVTLAGAQPTPTITPEQWRADIDTMAENLLERHPNFFSKHSVEEVEDAIEALDAKLDTLDDQQIVMEIGRIVALGGDAHTTVGFNEYAKAMHRLPIQVIVLSDGVFISAAAEPYAGLIGAEILKFGDTNAAEAFERVGELFAYENHSKLINTGTVYVTLMPALAGVGIADAFDADSFELTIKGDQGERTVTLDCTVPKVRQQWTSFAQLFEGDLPLAYRKSSGYYQTEFLADTKTMYLAYNKCQDAEDFPMKLLIEFIMTKSEDLDAQRLIIDLRFNGGGDETVLWPMMDALKKSNRFKDKGDIIVLISRWTFSSAMTNAHQLKERLGAILIGEPTGGKPNHFGQLDSFVLPNSGLTISHSTKWFQKVKGDPDAVEPDVLVEFDSAAFFGGRDPVLEAALNYSSPRESD
jgi:hypothetical protein